MGHSHSHSHDHAQSGLRKALAITVIFMFAEIFGGYFANSLALLSDGIHMATDSAALGFSLFAAWMTTRPAGKNFTYGYQRMEILGALGSGLALCLVAAFLIFESIGRFTAPPEVKGNWVIGIGTLGLGVNLISMRFLHAHQSHSLNTRAAYLHVVTDVLGSVAAIVSGIVIATTGWRLIDPLITCVFSLTMLWSAWLVVKAAIEVLMEKVPNHLSLEVIAGDLRQVPGVAAIHDLHIWTLSSGKVALSVHLSGQAGNETLVAANTMLKSRHDIHHTTIQLEDAGKGKLEHCEDCG